MKIVLPKGWERQLKGGVFVPQARAERGTPERLAIGTTLENREDLSFSSTHQLFFCLEMKIKEHTKL